MRIETTLDEVLYAATMGLEPDADDLALVTVPAGEDAQVFRSGLAATAAEIVARQRQGFNGDAREIAEAAKSEYEAKFAALMPAPAGGRSESIEDITARIFRR